MKLFAGLVILAAFAPYLVSGDSAGAAAAASGDDYSSAVAAATASGDDNSSSYAAATASGDDNSSSSAAATASGDDNSSSFAAATASGDDNSSTAAAASSSNDGSSTAAAASSSNDGSSTAAASATSEGGSSSAAAAAASSGDSSDPPVRCICDLVYVPVCGSDGLTYSNECVLNCISADRAQSGQTRIRKMYDGECKPISCNCNSVYQPVCGTNNQTYTNECWLACTNNRRIDDGLQPIGIRYRSACSRPSCLCPDSIIPVCGTDGKTYRNVCVMQCYSRSNVAQGKDPIFVRERNACRNENCPCSNRKDQLCASDDNTYWNRCVLDCQNRRRAQLGQKLLTIQYPGECIRCPCTADYNPVCANNDVTYSNYCQYLCENEKRRRAGLPELLLRWNGECNCGCDRQWSPICASDRRTYANRCLLRCENRKRYQDGRSQLREVSVGECRPCNCDYCSPVRRPVCGNDRRTYWNACYLNCNSDCRAAAGLSSLYIIKDSEC